MASNLTVFDNGITNASRPTLTDSRPTMPRADSFTTPYERVYWEPKPTFGQQCKQLLLDGVGALLEPFAYFAAGLVIMAVGAPLYFAYKYSESDDDCQLLDFDLDDIDLDAEEMVAEWAVEEKRADESKDKRVDSLF